jgi:hypothetical protein
VPEPDVRISEILYVYFDTPRKELEWVTLHNFGSGPQLMDSWRLFELGRGYLCRLPAGVVIEPGEDYQVRSGRDALPGVQNGIDGYVCPAGVDKLIWDNVKDQAHLINDANNMQDCRGYDPNLGFYDCK